MAQCCRYIFDTINLLPKNMIMSSYFLVSEGGGLRGATPSQDPKQDQA